MTVAEVLQPGILLQTKLAEAAGATEHKRKKKTRGNTNDGKNYIWFRVKEVNVT